MPPPTFYHRSVWSGAFAAFGLAYLWFHVFFRESFLEGLGKTHEEIVRSHSAFEAATLQLAGNFITAYVIGWLFKHLGVQRLSEGLALVAILWLGFVAAIITPLIMAQAFPLHFLAINAGGVLVQMLAMGAVMALWRL